MTPIAIIIGAIIAWFGNYYVQTIISSRLRFYHRIDKIKESLHEFMEISSIYWTLNTPRSGHHNNLEAKIIAKKHAILTEYSGIARKYKEVKRSHEDTEVNRISLWDASTGGCFQQKNWNPDPTRIRIITKETSQILKSLDEL